MSRLRWLSATCLGRPRRLTSNGRLRWHRDGSSTGDGRLRRDRHRSSDRWLRRLASNSGLRRHGNGSSNGRLGWLASNGSRLGRQPSRHRNGGQGRQARDWDRDCWLGGQRRESRNRVRRLGRPSGLGGQAWGWESTGWLGRQGGDRKGARRLGRESWSGAGGLFELGDGGAEGGLEGGGRGEEGEEDAGHFGECFWVFEVGKYVVG